MTNTGESNNSYISDEAIQELRNKVRGQVLMPGNEDYEAARVIWNAMVNKQPSVILRCCGSDDVITGVEFARTHEL